MRLFRFVSDHLQLPPTITCKEAAKEGLGVTLFSRLAKRLGEQSLTVPLPHPSIAFAATVLSVSRTDFVRV